MSHIRDSPPEIVQKLTFDNSIWPVIGFEVSLSVVNFVQTEIWYLSVMGQKESAVQFDPITWTVVQKVRCVSSSSKNLYWHPQFFGVPKRSKAKYMKNWEVSSAKYYSRRYIVFTDVTVIRLFLQFIDEGTTSEQHVEIYH